MKSKLFIVVVAVLCGVVSAQTPSQNPTQKQPQAPTNQAQGQTPLAKNPPTTGSTQTPAGPKGEVMEEIVARVNSDIVTTADLQLAKSEAADDARSQCAQAKCTPEELENNIAQSQKDALRDTIDQDLLVQRAKDLDINVETDLVKRLDEIRSENKFESLEDLQKAIESQGQDFDDFKNKLKNRLLTDAVIQREVTEKVTGTLDRNTLEAYYNQHKQDYTIPETVVIREILVSTDGKAEADLPALKKKAEQLRQRVLDGEDFGDLAQHFSDGSTARQGGELGHFERGQLTKQVEDVVFTLNRNEMTPVLTTPKGYLVVQVEQRYEAGIQPFDKVENQVLSTLASEQLPAKLRVYLDGLRKDSWVEVRPGYVDTGGSGSNSIMEAKDSAGEITKPDKKPRKHKKFLIF
jgi:peptidyl-prolyl cis-trans isomerase SurA